MICTTFFSPSEDVETSLLLWPHRALHDADDGTGRNACANVHVVPAREAEANSAESRLMDARPHAGSPIIVRTGPARRYTVRLPLQRLAWMYERGGDAAVDAPWSLASSLPPKARGGPESGEG